MVQYEVDSRLALVLICGDAGIGKASLGQEISRAAARLGTPAV